MKNYYLLILSLFLVMHVSGQTTMGLLYHDPEVSDGYILMSNRATNDVYLINTCGEVVNQWSFSQRAPVNYLLENGNILKAGRNVLEIHDWDDNVIWEVDVRDFGLGQHHDVEAMPNGNILILMRDIYTPEEAIAQGRRADLVADVDEVQSEKIIEIQPVGTDQLVVVWEWKFWDHLIQDHDNTKPNFGVISDHPELIDLNIETQSNLDWIHTNGIDYNPDLDQIVVSARHTSEIYIIDHSTTTAEAASHSGGNSGVGGDFLWRWGNPRMYGQGTVDDQTLFGQHDPSWIPEGYPNEGMISVFSNGLDRVPDFSSVHLIETQIDSEGNYELTSGIFEPMEFHWSWSGTILGETMFSISQSGANMQPNGNFVVCEATKGRISEISPEGDLLWSYLNPVALSPVMQGETIPSGQNVVFKSEKYPADYVGFDGLDLSSTSGIYENENENSEACIANLSVEEFLFSDIKLSPNPFNDYIMVQTGSLNEAILSVDVYNVTGQRLEGVVLGGQGINFDGVIPIGLWFVWVALDMGVCRCDILI